MHHSSSLPRSLVLLMATATGLAVASNYYAQPLLELLARDFGINLAHAGLLVTTAQLAYAAGLLLLVPLGDRFDRRVLIVGLYAFSAVGLIISACAHGFGLLLVGTLLTGACSVSAQLLVPFAATLAAPQQRGQVIGTVMSGLLLGILLARTASGLLAELGGWQNIYWAAAALTLLVAGLLWRGLPAHPGQATLPYLRLVGSVLTLLRDEPVLRSRSLLGGLQFACFSILWTTLAFLLAGPHYHYSTATIGLFGLIGAAGALAANLAGKLCDRGAGHWVSWGGLWLLLASWAVLAAAPHSLAALIVGILVLDMAVQAVHIDNQNVIYRLDPAARNRITAAYITCYFIGGALGSSAGAAAYALAGWNGVIGIGATLSVVALLWMLVTQRQHRGAAGDCFTLNNGAGADGVPSTSKHPVRTRSHAGLRSAQQGDAGKRGEADQESCGQQRFGQQRGHRHWACRQRGYAEAGNQRRWQQDAIACAYGGEPQQRHDQQYCRRERRIGEQCDHCRQRNRSPAKYTQHVRLRQVANDSLHLIPAGDYVGGLRCLSTAAWQL
jgi:predicted MFS family arabinose efflux permease